MPPGVGLLKEATTKWGRTAAGTSAQPLKIVVNSVKDCQANGFTWALNAGGRGAGPRGPRHRLGGHYAGRRIEVATDAAAGCTVDVGPAYDPNDRPFIERFFGTVAVRLIHRLPGTTGSSSDDILRKLRDGRGDLRLIVSLDELKELLAVLVWNYIGSPHSGLPGGRAQLEIIHRAVRNEQWSATQISQNGSVCARLAANEYDAFVIT